MFVGTFPCVEASALEGCLGFAAILLLLLAPGWKAEVPSLRAEQVRGMQYLLPGQLVSGCCAPMLLGWIAVAGSGGGGGSAGGANCPLLFNTACGGGPGGGGGCAPPPISTLTFALHVVPLHLASPCSLSTLTM